MLCNPTIITETNCSVDFGSLSLGGDRRWLFLTSKNQIYNIESIFSGHFIFSVHISFPFDKRKPSYQVTKKKVYLFWGVQGEQRCLQNS